MELIKKPIGPEGEFLISIEQGKLKVKAVHNHKSGNLMMAMEEDAGYFLDQLAKAIPGVLDDAILALIKEAVQKL